MGRISVCALLLLIGKQAVHAYNGQFYSSRRNWIQGVALTPFIATASVASAATGPTDGNLPELPPEAVRSYLQYRIPLQVRSVSETAIFFILLTRTRLPNI